MGLALLFLLSPSLFFADEVRVEALEYWQNGPSDKSSGESGWNDSLTVNQLIEASLVASGVELDNLDVYKSRFSQILQEFHSSQAYDKSALPEASGESIYNGINAPEESILAILPRQDCL